MASAGPTGEATGEATAEADAEGLASATGALVAVALDDGLVDGLGLVVAFGGLQVGWHAPTASIRTPNGAQVRQTLPLTLDRESMATRAQVRRSNRRIR